MPVRDDVSELIVECAPGDYSASIIARAVEDCDAHLINLNVLAVDSSASTAMVHLRVTHLDPAAVSRSLARYGYDTVSMTAASGDFSSDEAKERAREALHYLSVGSDS